MQRSLNANSIPSAAIATLIPNQLPSQACYSCPRSARSFSPTVSPVRYRSRHGQWSSAIMTGLQTGHHRDAVVEPIEEWIHT
jgi:hypothetical protein